MNPIQARLTNYGRRMRVPMARPPAMLGEENLPYENSPNQFDPMAQPTPMTGDEGMETSNDIEAMIAQMGSQPQATPIHDPASAQRLRGYGMPELDNPAFADPATKFNPLHAEQHRSITRGLNAQKQRKIMQLQIERQRLSEIIKGAKAGQNLMEAQRALQMVDSMLQTLQGVMPSEPETP